MLVKTAEELQPVSPPHHDVGSELLAVLAGS